MPQSQAVRPLLHTYNLTHTHTHTHVRVRAHTHTQPFSSANQHTACDGQMPATFDVICTPTYFPAESRDLSWLPMNSQPRPVVQLKTGQCPAGVRSREPLSFPGAWRNLHLILLKPLKCTQLKPWGFLPYPYRP